MNKHAKERIQELLRKPDGFVNETKAPPVVEKTLLSSENFAVVSVSGAVLKRGTKIEMLNWTQEHPEIDPRDYFLICLDVTKSD